MQQLEIFEFVPPLEWWIKEQIVNLKIGSETSFTRDDGQVLKVAYNGKAEHFYRGEVEDFSFQSQGLKGTCFSLDEIVYTVFHWLRYEIIKKARISPSRT